jgi:hypothetical protein
MQLSSEEQKVFNEQVEKIKALKLSSCASDALRNLLADEKPYDYFVGLGIPELYKIYRDLIVHHDTLSSDVYEIQTWCRFRNYQTFLIWTMLQQHADNNSWSESDWLFQVAHDLHTTYSVKYILTLLNKMTYNDRVDFFQKIEYRLAAPLLVEMEPHDAAKIIDWLSSDYPITTLIKEMHSLSDSDYRTAEIFEILSANTLSNLSSSMNLNILESILTKTAINEQVYICKSIDNPKLIAEVLKVFVNWPAWWDMYAWSIMNELDKQYLQSILNEFDDDETAKVKIRIS